ncbi:hypothetical protein [Cellulomonas hominis]|uniref:hypothetical protein n=1 Tax=Cellulomonas hominis TaxID=156981 RepID=UPI001B93919F|nr:hypothetical protein [Cellulomonas hominis]VTR76089.1 hypothetical protein CHMI_00845 [Cellulomonas hominis]
MGVLREPDPDLPADPRRATVLLRWSRVLRWSAAAMLLLPVAAAAWAVEIREPVVVAAWFVASPLVVGLALAVAATVVALGAAAVGLAAQEVGAPPGSRRWYVRWPVNTAKLALLLAGWAGAGLAFLFGLGLGDAHLLRPTSAGGCRVIVVERAYGGVDVYAAPAGAFRSRPVEDVYDSGWAPVSLGTYDLTWDGETADLVLRGMSFSLRPEDDAPARAVVDCEALSRREGSA